TDNDSGERADQGRGNHDLLTFHGERDAPEPLTKVMQRRFVDGDAAPPDDFAYAREHATVYIPPAPEGHKGSVEVEDVAEPENSGYQKLTFAVDYPGGIHLPGQEADRRPPRQIVAEVDSQIEVSAYRPPWSNVAYYPRPTPDPGQPELMRRIGGRATRPLYVFGGDNRLSYTDSSWPWGLVGKIFNSNGKVGSGALIGPRLVATAGHMVPWGGGSWWMKFVPAYHNGSSLHGAGVESYVSSARGYDVDGDVTGYDWAVLRLYQPLGSWLGYFGYNGFSSSWEDDPYWTILGYPSAVASGQRPSYQMGISVFDIDSDSNGGKELETKADLTPGNSGGPMFAWWSGDPRLVGVVSGQEEDWSPGFWPWEWGDLEKGNVVAGGAGFTNLMAWGRTNWP
ncbi:MAG: trypsin-like serine peptidase, partial [Acidimicrobiia bacterium]